MMSHNNMNNLHFTVSQRALCTDLGSRDQQLLVETQVFLAGSAFPRSVLTSECVIDFRCYRHCTENGLGCYSLLNFVQTLANVHMSSLLAL